MNIDEARRNHVPTPTTQRYCLNGGCSETNSAIKGAVMSVASAERLRSWFENHLAK